MSKTIKEVLEGFDKLEKKGFDAHDVLGALSSIDDELKTYSDYKYEVLAFRLVSAHGDCPWETYYGPMLSYINEDGFSVYSPSFEEITIEAIDYWLTRIVEVNNPLLKMRYAGLVWEFEQKVAHRRHCDELYLNYVESLLQVCNGDYSSHPVITADVLERLFVVSKDNAAYLKKTKDAYKDFEVRHTTDDAVRLWASRFLIMLEHKKYFSTEEKNAIVAEHEDRLKRLTLPDVYGRINPWNVQNQAELLARYYHSVHSVTDVNRVLYIEEQAFLHEKANMSAMQLMGNLELVHREYRHYGLEKEATRLSVEIQKCGEKVIAEMQPYQVEFKIPHEVFDQADQMFGYKAESDEMRWKNFCIYFIPRVSNEKNALKQLVKKYPFQFMMATKMMDSNGRPMSVVGPYDLDPDGQLILHITEKLNLDAHFLGIAINRMLVTKALTANKVMEYLIEPSLVFDEDRYEIINHAVQFFIDAKYELFNHLIVPQIETAICNLVERSGAAVIKPQKNGKGFQLRLLDDLLREKAVSDAFTNDGAYYLRLVLTDQRALNIRNILCHGLLPPSYLASGAACRLLHVLAMLGTLRPYVAVC